MCRRAGRWVVVAAPVLLACACDARPLSLVARADAGAGTPPASRDAAPTDAAPGAGSADRGGAGGTGGMGGMGGMGGSIGGGGSGPGGSGGATDGGGALCAAIDLPAPDVASNPPPAPPPPPTQLPFSCQPLPTAFFFPPPGAGVPGQFSRCASYDVGATTALSVSPDGALVALVTGDGIVRVVEVASRRVIGVLAPPRATIDYAAFAPDGRSIMTVARGEREVTLWRTVDWTPAWRVTVPGMPYYHLFGGGVAFAPDGKSAVVSPGSDTFVIDVATGAVRAQRTPGSSAVLDVGYGWGGRRIVVAEPSLDAHCVHTPNGGTVTVLDADTLAPIATIANLGSYGGEVRGNPAFRASPTDDLVLVPASVGDTSGRAVHAFRLSDGGERPAPALDALPAAFMPDGATLLVAADRTLERVRLSDGTLISATTAGASGLLAVSADGSTVAMGGSGANLLRVWQTASSAPPAAVCAAADPIVPGYLQRAASLSGDGQSLALATGAGVKVFRRDGVLRADLAASGSPYLSPSGALVAVEDSSPLDLSPTAVLRVADGAVLGQVPFDSWNWATFVFSAREDRLYSPGMRGNYRLDVVDLTTGTPSVTNVDKYTIALGTSDGCPVLYAGGRGAWRACGGCDDPAVGAGSAMGFNGTYAVAAVLSGDGRYVAIRPSADATSVALWRMPPAAGQIAILGGRPPLGSLPAHEFPVAVGPGGSLALTAAEPNASCYDGPAFEILLHDVAAGAVIDHLPPAPAAVDAAMRTVAYGAQLWCAR